LCYINNKKTGKDFVFPVFYLKNKKKKKKLMGSGLEKVEFYLVTHTKLLTIAYHH